MKLSIHHLLTVVMPKNPTTREEFACSELTKYLKMIFSGIRIAVVDDTKPATGNRILLGGPERNSQTALYIGVEQFDGLVPGPEGIFLKSFDKDVLICAGSSKNPNECERGTIYAVYELLERFLGCSLAAFTNPDIVGGEYVSSLTSIELSQVSYIRPCADTPYRTAIVQYSHADVSHTHQLTLPFFDWLCKNRYNRILLWASTYEAHKKAGLIQEAERRGLRFTVGHHEASDLFIPSFGNEYFPEHYYETHPEYYRLTEQGERFKSEGIWGAWIFCSRNQDLIRQMADNICQWITLNPIVDCIALWQKDGHAPQCTCPDCARYSLIENYAYFLHEVAKLVHQRHPHVLIDMLVYSRMWDCPQDLKLGSDILVEEATWYRGGLRSVGKPDGSCLNGTLYEENLLRWKQTGAQVAYYEYYMGVYPARNRYMPAADELQSIFRRISELGIIGSGTQIECFNIWNNLFNFYCFGRTAYDTSASMEDLLQSFTLIFGKGKDHIAEIIRILEHTMDGQTSIMNASLHLMKNLDITPIDVLFEKAFAAADTPLARNNIRLLRMVLRYSKLEAMNTVLFEDKDFVNLEPCPDETGELTFMSKQFDSFYWNDPGFGIMLPVDCKPQVQFEPDHWYDFEHKQ